LQKGGDGRAPEGKKGILIKLCRLRQQANEGVGGRTIAASKSSGAGRGCAGKGGGKKKKASGGNSRMGGSLSLKGIRPIKFRTGSASKEKTGCADDKFEGGRGGGLNRRRSVLRRKGEGKTVGNQEIED